MGRFGKLETDVHIRASASKLREIYHERTHHISNVSADKVHGVDLLEGEWGEVGSIICWRYFQDGKARIAKEKIEAVDKENNLITFTVIEGDLMEKYKSFKFKMQFIPKEKESVIHWVLEYEKLHDDIPDSHTMLQLCVDVAKDIDAHLMEGSEEP